MQGLTDRFFGNGVTTQGLIWATCSQGCRLMCAGINTKTNCFIFYCRCCQEIYEKDKEGKLEKIETVPEIYWSREFF